MLVEHRGKRPTVHPGAHVAPTAVLCGEVTVGEGSSVLFGAVVTAEGGPVTIGRECIVMENAVVRGSPGHPASLADGVLVGPGAHITGCTVGGDSFLATGSTVFTGARLGRTVEVRINGVVHINSRLPDGAMVPIGWVAVGDPAEILPPDAHDRIWAIQKALDFPRTVWGVERTTSQRDQIQRYARGLLRHHGGDGVLEDP